MQSAIVTAPLACNAFALYARHFERRPEQLFNRWVIVHDASFITETTSRREKLQVIQTADVFADASAVFLGFGKPNTYLTVPDGLGGYQKFAGKSARLDKSVIADTKGRVQSGILLHFLNLPEEAIPFLREQMALHHGKRYITCVNVNARIMEGAGFTTGGKALSKHYLPNALLRTILVDGLFYKGQKVEFNVIRTTPVRMENFAVQIKTAEISAFCRHADRAIFDRSQESVIWRGIYNVLHFPGAVLRKIKRKPVSTSDKVASPLPEGLEYRKDIHVRLSLASRLGTILRLVWGAHPLFEGEQNRIQPEGFFTRTLEPFPKVNSVVTWVKKNILFSRPVLWVIHRFLAPNYAELGPQSEAEIFEMLRTHSDEESNVYNIVIMRTSRNLENGVRFVLSRIKSGARTVAWVLSKHVLSSNYDPGVLFAGEIYKDVDGLIHLTGNSGTYQPTLEELHSARDFLAAVFPHVTFVVDSCDFK